MLKVVTFNAAILDICIFGHSFYRPVDHIEQRLHQLSISLEKTGADIIFLQELFHRDNQEQLCNQLRKSYPYIKGLAPSGWKFRLGNELLIFSRYPLFNGSLTRFMHGPAEELRHTSKGFYHAIVDLPELGNVNLINMHMSAGGKHGHPESPDMDMMREKQIEQILDYSRELNYMILAGDLNAGPDTSNRNYQQVLSAGYKDIFSLAGIQGISWDPDNPLVKQGRESHLPPQRIDHVFTDQALHNCIQEVEAGIILDEHCVDSEEASIPLSDHYGLNVNISWKAGNAVPKSTHR